MRLDDFSTFFAEIHGYEPFPWQLEVLHQMNDSGEWPSHINVPTGMGKTSVLDIAVFLMAFHAREYSAHRLGRRRIFFVVDRRIVVDQASRHGQLIADRIKNSEPGSVCHAVRDRLVELGGNSEVPLGVVTMRGGTTWDAAWVDRPDRPFIVTGTVDQVGSQLLFRGYGVSDRRQPINASLVGMDSVIFVDEAHISQALTTTVTSIAEYEQPTEELPIPFMSMVQLSATGTKPEGGWSYEFNFDDHANHPVAQNRVWAAKTLNLVSAKQSAVSKTLVTHASELAQEPGARVLVVCNTVDTAREVFDKLNAAKPKKCEEPTENYLLIGRSRPIDRERLTTRVLELFGADREPSDTRAILVATQTVEVGIDLDATGLVTECAAWDALVQRIGRLNRRGVLESSEVVVVASDKREMPVYGGSAYATAEYLRNQKADQQPMDVSPSGLRECLPTDDMVVTPPYVPMLLPMHLDALTRTAPKPANDIDVAPYLHGIDERVPPVSVVWRSGLLKTDGAAQSVSAVSRLLAAVPIRTEEMVDIPISAFRRWAAAETPTMVSDLDIDDAWDVIFKDQEDFLIYRQAELTLLDSRQTKRGWRTEQLWETVHASDVRPGDLVVVASESGGLDAYGWNPASTETVMDVSELAALRRERPYLRVDRVGRDGLDGFGLDPEIVQSVIAELHGAEEVEVLSDVRDRAIAVLTEAIARILDPSDEDIPASPWTHDDLRQLADKLEGSTLVPFTDDEGLGLLLVGGVRRSDWRSASDEEVDGSVHVGERVTLRSHSNAVGTRAREIAENLMRDSSYSKIVELAGVFHDIGKVEERFQATLCGGDAVVAELLDEPLAKSGYIPEAVDRRAYSRTAAGLPPSARHEAWSEALFATYLASQQSVTDGQEKLAVHQEELALHLVASHHGHCRPLFPICIDDAQHPLVLHIDGDELSVELPHGVNFETVDRFDRLNTRYGRWGLALLEAIVRCADMTISAEGS